MLLLKLYYHLEMRDSAGRLVRRTRRRRCRSFVKQWLQLVRAKFNYGTSEATVKDTSGVEQTTAKNGNAADLLCSGANNSDVRGPVVGTGTTAVTIDDYALATQIAHGTGSGQLDHEASSFGVITLVGTSYRFTLSRAFVNSSGDTITIQEVGLYAQHQLLDLSWGYFLICRDLVSGGHAVPDTYSVTLVYTFEVAL